MTTAAIFGIVGFSIVLLVIPFSVWRIAKRSGHGRPWDYLFALMVFAAIANVFSAFVFPVEQICIQQLESLACKSAAVLDYVSYVYPALIGSLIYLAFKSWPLVTLNN